LASSAIADVAIKAAIAAAAPSFFNISLSFIFQGCALFVVRGRIDFAVAATNMVVTVERHIGIRCKP
jgi:hypothetical protein